MKLFLSYPSAERSTADRLALALEAEGHEVFFDRSDLPSGEAYHQRLREAIEAADAMVFLITPAAVAPGSYTLAELDIARRRWRRPAGHVLPVMVAATPIPSLPPYLAAVTLLQPRGELVAETVAAVARLGGGGRRKWVPGLVVAVLLLGALAWGGAQWTRHRAAETAALAALQRDETAATQALQLCQDGNHAAALQQLSELAAHQPPAPRVQALREDCAMLWTRGMRSTSGGAQPRTFAQQVAVVEPVLLQGLVAAQGVRAADLRAHLGWGEYLRGREGSGNDPVPHWQRALADDPGNVFAHAMWGHRLLPAQLVQARQHFDQAVASGRERAFVRELQFGGTLGGNDTVTAYAVVVADEMRRGGEPLSPALRMRLDSYAFGSRLLQPEARHALQAALPAAALLATYEWLVPAADRNEPTNLIARFNQASLQAQAGQREAARTGLEALRRDLRAEHRSGRLVDQTEQALAALGPR